MEQEEIRIIANQVAQIIKEEATSIDDLPKTDTLTGVYSLPGIQNGKVVEVMLSLLKGVDGKSARIYTSEAGIMGQMGDDAPIVLISFETIENYAKTAVTESASEAAKKALKMVEDAINNLNSLDQNVTETIEQAATQAAEAAEEQIAEAEEQRVAAEQKRINAENTRSESETNRVSAEEQREQKETTRISEENNRVSSETARVKAETARDAAEKERVTAENLRSKKEKERLASEKTRLQSEEQREQNENNRVKAETARVKAEEEREALKTDMITAKDAANTAAQNAEDKAQEAGSAADRANTAAETAEGVAAGVITKEAVENVLKGEINSHTHPAATQEKAGFLSAADKKKLDELQQGVTEVAWGDISGKPETFKPETHEHTASEITDFEDSVTELLPDLSAYETKTNADKKYAKKAHNHTASEITDFQAKVKEYAPATDLSAYETAAQALAKYALKQHAHTVEEITDLLQSLANNLASANEYTDTKISEIIGTAPEVLDSIQELANAIGDDPNFSVTVANMVAEKLDKSVFELRKQAVDTRLLNLENQLSGLDAALDNLNSL